MDSSSPSGKRSDIAVVKMHGYVESVMAQELEDLLDRALNAQCCNFVVDLSEADYLSSSGWGMFIGEIKRIRDGGGDLKLVGMQPYVLEVFELLEFDRILRHYDSVEEAVSAFEDAKKSTSVS
jgi:anti-sigma B factor antagonist